jgi:hypothetical protein
MSVTPTDDLTTQPVSDGKNRSLLISALLITLVIGILLSIGCVSAPRTLAPASSTVAASRPIIFQATRVPAHRLPGAADPIMTARCDTGTAKCIVHRDDEVFTPTLKRQRMCYIDRDVVAEPGQVVTFGCTLSETGTFCFSFIGAEAGEPGKSPFIIVKQSISCSPARMPTSAH